MNYEAGQAVFAMQCLLDLLVDLEAVWDLRR